MLISHEVPISILEQSKKFNDYDYCLLHLIFESEQYKQFYIESVAEGRKVLLDNSLFELGDSMAGEKLAEGIKIINPTWYVVPDCQDDADTTINRFEAFIKDYPNLPGLKIGVVHGKTLEDITRCYKYMSEHADKIAITFDEAAYEEYNIKGNLLERRCKGRQHFIQDLVDKGIWNNNKPHHLLGCSLAKEFAYPLYSRISIETIDTSNPVVSAIKGFRYKKDGLSHKPTAKLCDLIDHRFTNKEYKNLKHNVMQFRKNCGEYIKVRKLGFFGINSLFKKPANVMNFPLVADDYVNYRKKYFNRKTEWYEFKRDDQLVALVSLRFDAYKENEACHLNTIEVSAVERKRGLATFILTKWLPGICKKKHRYVITLTPLDIYDKPGKRPLTEKFYAGLGYKECILDGVPEEHSRYMKKELLNK